MAELIKTPQHLGKIVRRDRKALRLTQPQLALAAGVGVRFIVDLEAGKPTVRLENVLRVLQVLGINILLDSPCDTKKAQESGHEPRP